MDISLRMEIKELIEDLKELKRIDSGVFYSRGIYNRSLKIMQKVLKQDR